jgi:hypothetical protein
MSHNASGRTPRSAGYAGGRERRLSALAELGLVSPRAASLDEQHVRSSIALALGRASSPLSKPRPVARDAASPFDVARDVVVLGRAGDAVRRTRACARELRQIVVDAASEVREWVDIEGLRLRALLPSLPSPSRRSAGTPSSPSAWHAVGADGLTEPDDGGFAPDDITVSLLRERTNLRSRLATLQAERGAERAMIAAADVAARDSVPASVLFDLSASLQQLESATFAHAQAAGSAAEARAAAVELAAAQQALRAKTAELAALQAEVAADKAAARAPSGGSSVRFAPVTLAGALQDSTALLSPSAARPQAASVDLGPDGEHMPAAWGRLRRGLEESRSSYEAALAALKSQQVAALEEAEQRNEVCVRESAAAAARDEARLRAEFDALSARLAQAADEREELQTALQDCVVAFAEDRSRFLLRVPASSPSAWRFMEPALEGRWEANVVTPPRQSSSVEAMLVPGMGESDTDSTGADTERLQELFQSRTLELARAGSDLAIARAEARQASATASGREIAWQQTALAHALTWQGELVSTRAERDALERRLGAASATMADFELEAREDLAAARLDNAAAFQAARTAVARDVVALRLERDDAIERAARSSKDVTALRATVDVQSASLATLRAALAPINARTWQEDQLRASIKDSEGVVAALRATAAAAAADAEARQKEIDAKDAQIASLTASVPRLAGDRTVAIAARAAKAEEAAGEAGVRARRAEVALAAAVTRAERAEAELTRVRRSAAHLQQFVGAAQEAAAPPAPSTPMRPTTPGAYSGLTPADIKARIRARSATPGGFTDGRPPQLFSFTGDIRHAASDASVVKQAPRRSVTPGRTPGRGKSTEPDVDPRTVYPRPDLMPRPTDATSKVGGSIRIARKQAAAWRLAKVVLGRVVAAQNVTLQRLALSQLACVVANGKHESSANALSALESYLGEAHIPSPVAQAELEAARVQARSAAAKLADAQAALAQARTASAAAAGMQSDLTARLTAESAALLRARDEARRLTAALGHTEQERVALEEEVARLGRQVSELAGSEAEAARAREAAARATAEADALALESVANAAERRMLTGIAELMRAGERARECVTAEGAALLVHESLPPPVAMLKEQVLATAAVLHSHVVARASLSSALASTMEAAEAARAGFEAAQEEAARRRVESTAALRAAEAAQEAAERAATKAAAELSIAVQRSGKLAAELAAARRVAQHADVSAPRAAAAPVAALSPTLPLAVPSTPGIAPFGTVPTRAAPSPVASLATPMRAAPPRPA